MINRMHVEVPLPKCLSQAAQPEAPCAGLLSSSLQVLCVDPHTPTLLAYKQMLNAGVSGAAVKANGNSMIANLSISDLRPVCALVKQPPDFAP